MVVGCTTQSWIVADTNNELVEDVRPLVGMNTEKVRAQLGEPQEIIPHGSLEVWHYERTRYFRRHAVARREGVRLYFAEGVLKYWEADPAPN
jgi:hypothetical protein